jgi:hypothetical protein
MRPKNVFKVKETAAGSRAWGEMLCALCGLGGRHLCLSVWGRKGAGREVKMFCSASRPWPTSGPLHLPSPPRHTFPLVTCQLHCWPQSLLCSNVPHPCLPHSPISLFCVGFSQVSVTSTFMVGFACYLFCSMSVTVSSRRRDPLWFTLPWSPQLPATIWHTAGAQQQIFVD